MNKHKYNQEYQKFFFSSLLSNQRKIDKSILGRTFFVSFHINRHSDTGFANNKNHYDTADKISLDVYKKIVDAIDSNDRSDSDLASALISVDVEATRINRRTIS